MLRQFGFLLLCIAVGTLFLGAAHQRNIAPPNRPRVENLNSHR